MADALTRVESISVSVNWYRNVIALNSVRISAQQALKQQLPHLFKSPHLNLHRLEIDRNLFVYSEGYGAMKP